MTVNFFDTTFYDAESGHYSDKRYTAIAVSYIQFLFQERLRRVRMLVGKYVNKSNKLLLLEDGCADGVVVKNIYESYRHVFDRVVGTDISPGMIQVAQKNTKDKSIEFYIKKDIPHTLRADVILAVGFVSPSIFKDECIFIKQHLNRDGVVILSLVSNNSLHALFKLKGKEILKDYWSYSAYDKYLSHNFDIIEKVPYGFFVPKLWTFPIIGRLMQPVFEVCGKIFPSLFHETLYVLKEKR